MAGRNLGPLLEARNGKPTESKAAGVIGTFAVIPAAIVGLLGGLYVVGWNAPANEMTWACILGAAGGGIGVYLLIWIVYNACGFRPLVFVADMLTGAFTGLFTGAALSRAADSWWPFLLCPFLAVAFPLIAPRASPTTEPFDKEISDKPMTEPTDA